MDKRNIEIDITHDHKELNEWVERIAKTANKICNDLAHNRLKLNGQLTGFIMELNDAGALGCLGWAIEQHLDAITPKLKPAFQKILDDTKIKKENLERS